MTQHEEMRFLRIAEPAKLPVMIDIDQALSIVLEHARPLPSMQIELRHALFRTLAQPVATDIDQPPFDRSLMDGFAVRAQDTEVVPATLTIVGQIAAGALPKGRIGPGQAMQVNTGAPIPCGADAVVRVERTETSEDGAFVSIKECVKPDQFVTRRANYRRAGQQVLPVGTLLTPANMGVAAAAGAATVSAYRKPRVAIIVTGNELVDIGERPVGARIRNSNQFVLEALVRSAFCDPVMLGTCRDERAAIRDSITSCAECDTICMTGGISMGAFDFVPEVLVSMGARIHVQKISIKPGRPTLFAMLPNGQAVFALPGNPVSAFVGFHLLVAPWLSLLQGRRHRPPVVRGILRGKLPAEGQRQAYYPARLSLNADGGFETHLLSWHGSGDAIGMAHASAMIIRPPGSPPAADGQDVRFFPLDGAMQSMDS